MADCDRPPRTRGWCNAHYQRWYKTGDPLKIRPAKWDGYVRPTCSVDDCDRPAHARGLCTIHGPRQRRHGDPLAGRRQNSTGTEAERFASMHDTGPGCWRWNAGTVTGGYGTFNVGDGVQVYAHRWSYEHHVGPIPDGLPLDHVCHNVDPTCPAGDACQHRRCVNPAHLEPVSYSENSRRGRARMKAARLMEEQGML